MAARRWTMACAAVVLAGTQLFPAWLHALTGASQATVQAPADDNSVPSDLGPLLAAPESELRLVTHRYNTDRATLNGNYDGGRGPGRGGRGGAGRGGRGMDAAPAAPAPAPASAPAPLSLSTNRIARLKRFDMSWLAALAKIDSSTLSTAATADLVALRAALQANLTALDTDAATGAQLMPLVPFAPAIIKLNEARIRMEDLNSQQSAGVLTQLTPEIGRVKARVEAGLNGGANGDALKVSKDLATRGADSVDGLRNSVTTWFNFYNNYDPLFTWWMGMPYKQVDAALQDYAAFLRDKVAPADAIAAPAAAAAAATIIPPAPATKLNEVPDLREIIALPQDELRAVVQRFVVSGGGRGGRGATNSPGGGRPRQYYLDWLAALQTLDFDGLSRNAQVDYLFIKKTSERQMGFGDDWKRAVEKVKGMYVPPGGQPAVVRDMLFEAVDYLRAKDLITVPQIASESFHMSMMSPEAQLSAPFFLGGLQLRGLRKELVDSRQMTNQQVHDEIMRQGSMPIALVRLALTTQKLTRDMSIDWKFYGDLPAQ